MGKSDLLDGEIKVIQEHIYSGNIVFDVGAYVGEWSNEVLKRFPNVIIHQFEPSPESFKNLLKNSQNNINPKQIIRNNIVISNKNHPVTFYYYQNCPVLSTTYRRNEKVEKEFNLEVRNKEVNSTTIDIYCGYKGIQHINFLKIDTEGCEFDVIRGSEGLLRNKSINYIQFEYGGCFIDSKTTLKEVFDYLKSFEYGVFKILPEGLTEITNFTPDLENYEYSNFLAY